MRASILSGFILSLSACYTVEFDEQASDAYYCQVFAPLGASDDAPPTQCLETHRCAEFRCADDRGPHVAISGPELLTEFSAVDPGLGVSFDLTDLDGNPLGGSDRVLLTIDPHKPEPISLLVAAGDDSAVLEFGSGLEPGPHRLVAEVQADDGTPYTNPSATSHTVFIIKDVTTRPRLALLEPGPGHVHVVGQELEVRIAVSNFQFAATSSDCHVAEGCDPFTLDATCSLAEMGCTEVNRTGHAHIYLREDYPGCLTEGLLGCNDDYIGVLRPTEGNADVLSLMIEADNFPEAGTFTLSAALQYGNHAAYPNKTFVVFDQMPITIIER